LEAKVSMSRYVLSSTAERDIESILVWTQEQFGSAGRLRYEALLVQAILDVAEDPERVGSQNRPEIAPAARTYHLYFSGSRVDANAGRVRRPRHFLLYRICRDGAIEIGRVLHDSMDLAKHLPEEYRAETIDQSKSELL
jgi:toxin ParE1/3/4